MGLLLLAGCAVEEVWTGAICSEAGRCGLGVDAGSSNGDARAPALPGCPNGRFELDVVATYAASASGVCFVTGPSDRMVTDGIWHLALVSRPQPDGSAAVEGCIRVPGQGEDAGMTDIDFRAAVRGQMDCTSGTLIGEIRATYNVVSVCTLGLLPTRYFATGPIAATYDVAHDVFRDGRLDMREPPVLLGDTPGGSGTWQGSRAPADDASVITDELPCLGGQRFPDELFAGDGGTSLGDAGSPDGALATSARDAAADATP